MYSQNILAYIVSKYSFELGLAKCGKIFPILIAFKIRSTYD